MKVTKLVLLNVPRGYFERLKNINMYFSTVYKKTNSNVKCKGENTSNLYNLKLIKKAV